MSELKEDIKYIRRKLEGEQKDKNKSTRPFRIPSKGKVNTLKAKNNYVTLIKINENGMLDIKRVKIEEQTFMEEGIPRLASAGYVMYYKKTPVIILPSWSVEPFSPMEHYGNSLLNGSNSAGYKLLLNTMKLETVEGSKKKMGGSVKWIIGIILAVIIGYALLTGS